ncbi:hypothetical protein [Burkholderia ubonensis]|uniref:hypothetical protein n=1 Tax=Burkholderia ubonensis TaxID=101571 RepID=UPI0012FE5F45|nr:hypothetical protein [Burkholderia ubonensis]
MALHIRRMLIGSRTRQRGMYDLLSIGIGATIAIAGATVGLWQKRQDMLAEQMAAQGDIVRDIGNSINGQYLSKYYSNLVNGTGVPGVANAYAPTMAELQAINVLPAGLATTSAYGTPYVVSLAKIPAACVAPNCDVGGVVYIAGAITDPSTGNPMPLGDGAGSIGGDGGYSDLASPGTITGMNGGWSLANPMGGVAGVLAMRVGYGSSGWSAYVRRDGSLPMEGDLNFLGTTGARHNIANAQTVNAQQLVTPAGNGVQIGGSLLYGDGSNSAIRQNGALYVQNAAGNAAADINVGNANASGSVNASGNVNAAGNANASLDLVAGRNVWASNGAVTASWLHSTGSVQIDSSAQVNGSANVNGTISSGSRLYSNEYVQVNGWAAQGASCSPNGLIANSGSGPLFCQSGVWKSPGEFPVNTLCASITEAISSPTERVVSPIRTPDHAVVPPAHGIRHDLHYAPGRAGRCSPYDPPARWGS